MYFLFLMRSISFFTQILQIVISFLKIFIMFLDDMHIYYVK